MSGHRIELRVTFTVGDGIDGGREAAEAVLRQFEYLADHGQLDNYTTDAEVWPVAVDGNSWHEKWPPKPKPKAVHRCGFLVEYSSSVFTDQPGAYRVSKDGQSNIFGEAFIKNMIGAGDAVFEQFMTMALKPDFPHPFAMEESP